MIPSQPPVSLNFPTFIGNYEILEKVGAGGLGEVFKARHVKSQAIVALKRLHARYQRNAKLLGLFHKETMIHARVDHKNCVRFLEAHLRPPQAHIVTTFVDGYNCHYLSRHAGPVPPLIACSILLDMLQGLEHLHCLDIVHSDITPSNVMVERTGRVLLADFGLSCLNEVENYEGMSVGTPGYQAPERMTHNPITYAADIYGTGIIFYEMLKGERLFGNLSPQDTLKKMKDLDVNWVLTGSTALDGAIRNILSTALHFKANKRYASTRDFMYAVYSCLKITQIRYTRRAILQWLLDKKLSQLPPPQPVQKIYVHFPS